MQKKRAIQCKYQFQWIRKSKLENKSKSKDGETSTHHVHNAQSNEPAHGRETKLEKM